MVGRAHCYDSWGSCKLCRLRLCPGNSCHPIGRSECHHQCDFSGSFSFVADPTPACTNDGQLTFARDLSYLSTEHHIPASLDAYMSLSHKHVMQFSVEAGRKQRIVEGRLFRPVLSPMLTSKFTAMLRAPTKDKKMLAQIRCFDDVIEYAWPLIQGGKCPLSDALRKSIAQTWSLACYTSTAAAAGLGNYTLLQNMIKTVSNYVWQAKAAACAGLLVPPQHGQDDVELFVGAFTSMQFGTLLAQRPPAAYDESKAERKPYPRRGPGVPERATRCSR